MDENYFKGWAKPGPIIPKSKAKDLARPGETLDALCGHYRIFQLEKGHRFSTDDFLVAWYGTTWCPCPRTVLDLGSGIGAVGMLAAWRLHGARFVTVEAQETSVALARRSCQYNELEDRYEIRHGDLRDPNLIRPDEKFDLIMGSPPYFPIGSGIEGDHPQKIACRFELRGSVVDYCRVASEHLNLGGFFSIIFPIAQESQLKRVEAAAREAQLTIVRSRPIVFKEGEPPLLSLFGMMRSDHLPESFRDQTWKEPPLVIRKARRPDTGGSPDDSVHEEYRALKLALGFPP